MTDARRPAPAGKTLNPETARAVLHEARGTGALPESLPQTAVTRCSLWRRIAVWRPRPRHDRLIRDELG